MDKRTKIIGMRLNEAEMAAVKRIIEKENREIQKVIPGFEAPTSLIVRRIIAKLDPAQSKHCSRMLNRSAA